MDKRPFFDPYVATSPALNRSRRPSVLPADFDAEAVIPMHYNESLVGPSPAVVEMLQRQGPLLSSYPEGANEVELREKLALIHGNGITPDHIVIGNAGSEVMQFVADGFLREDDEIIICPPTFALLNLLGGRRGAKIVEVPLLEETFQPDLDGMLAAVTPRTRIIYLCNPNNPTGNFVPGAIYDALLDNISDDIVIISDEVYKPFVTHPDYPDTTPLIHAGKNLIQVYSFSKAYGLAGLRLGYGIASPEIAGYLARLMRFFHLGRLTLNAGLAAVDDQAHMKRTVDTIVAGREWLTEQLQALGVRVWPSQGNFILVSAGIPGQQMVERLLAAGIMVTDGGPRFKLPDCIRVTVGLPEHNRRFVSAIKEIINNPSNVNTN